MSQTTLPELDDGISNEQDWPIDEQSGGDASGAVRILSQLSSITPIVLVLIAVTAGAWFFANPAPRKGAKQTASPFSWASWYSGGKPGKGTSYTGQLRRQADDNNAELQRIQSDINSRMNSGWRPGG